MDNVLSSSLFGTFEILRKPEKGGEKEEQNVEIYISLFERFFPLLAALTFYSNRWIDTKYVLVAYISYFFTSLLFLFFVHLIIIIVIVIIILIMIIIIIIIITISIVIIIIITVIIIIIIIITIIVIIIIIIIIIMTIIYINLCYFTIRSISSLTLFYPIFIYLYFL